MSRTKPSPLSHSEPDARAGLRVGSLVGGLHLMPVERLYRETRGGVAESTARQHFAFLLHTACGLSINRVAEVLGRDRSTVSYAVKKVEEAVEDEGRATLLDRLAPIAVELVGLGADYDRLVAAFTARELQR